LIDGQSLMVFPRGSELSSVSGPDFHVYTCSIPEELLSAVGEALEVGDMDEVTQGVGHHPVIGPRLITATLTGSAIAIPWFSARTFG
jgi:hypothetical protein